MRCILILFFLLSPITLLAGSGDSWPHWGGPHGNFKLPKANIADTWPDGGPKELWRRDLGAGYSGIVGKGKMLYTAYYKDSHEVIVCIDAGTGETIWEYKYSTTLHDSQVAQFGKGPNAVPVLHKGKLYTLSWNVQVHCLDAATGGLQWQRHLENEVGAEKLRFGAAAAPVIYKNMLMVQAGGDKGVLGLSLKDGSTKWESEILPVNYAAPAFFKTGDLEQMVFMAKKEAVSVNMADGKVLWRVPHTNQYDVHAAQPLWTGKDNILMVLSQRGGGAKTVKVADDGKSAKVLAESNLFNIFHSNAVVQGNTTYGANDKVLMALNNETGELHWRERGYDRANLIQVGDKWLVLTETGKLSLARLSPQKFELLASHQYLTKPAWTAPTLLGNHLYMRDKKTMIALDLGK